MEIFKSCRDKVNSTTPIQYSLSLLYRFSYIEPKLRDHVSQTVTSSWTERISRTRYGGGRGDGRWERSTRVAAELDELGPHEDFLNWLRDICSPRS
ncbi:hypothetical protein GWI33_016327 [Rhynchophorus ferrugineus]|uniref:Uncharacterized protein n=1 Tax=Rhynchophorus ferrugineus TaxID=354439 RepID=A0A834I3S6_RHYFE|nr:hypothetical protein GWI33_016327 [Rhynchophorus ferrugineus]